MSISSRFADKAPKPMQKNEVQSFSIDYTKHKNCELIDKDKKKVKKYFVKKTKDGQHWLFTASTNKDFNEVDKKSWFLGNAYCNDAWLERVGVTTTKGPPGSSGLDQVDPNGLEAQRCGIGTILSTLCFIDKDVNYGSGIVFDLKPELKGTLFNPEDKEMIEKAKQDCENVLGLQMSASKGGGNTYFKAATLAGFNRMIFFDEYEKNEWIWPTVSEAKSCYNENRLGCQHDKWYFCKEKSASQTNRASCLRKLVPSCLKAKNLPK